MDDKVKAEWIKALRSGEYKQCKELLYRQETGGYCCLGVLARTMGKTSDELVDGLSNWMSLGGIDSELAEELADMNDRGVRFKTIADYIEGQK